MKTKTDDTHKDVVPWMLNFEKQVVVVCFVDQENLTICVERSCSSLELCACVIIPVVVKWHSEGLNLSSWTVPSGSHYDAVSFSWWNACLPHSDGVRLSYLHSVCLVADNLANMMHERCRAIGEGWENNIATRSWRPLARKIQTHRLHYSWMH